MTCDERGVSVQGTTQRNRILVFRSAVDLSNDDLVFDNSFVLGFGVIHSGWRTE